MPTSKPVVKSGTRLVLLAGFGGLLGLMAVGGFDAIQVLHQIQARNVQIRRIFLSRNRALEQIRSALYLSGTFVRDYLLDPEIGMTDILSPHQVRTFSDCEVRWFYEHLLGLPDPPTASLALDKAGSLLMLTVQNDEMVQAVSAVNSLHCSCRYGERRLCLECQPIPT